jgi:hypothetical protein
VSIEVQVTGTAGTAGHKGYLPCTHRLTTHLRRHDPLSTGS